MPFGFINGIFSKKSGKGNSWISIRRFICGKLIHFALNCDKRGEGHNGFKGCDSVSSLLVDA